MSVPRAHELDLFSLLLRYPPVGGGSVSWSAPDKRTGNSSQEWPRRCLTPPCLTRAWSSEASHNGQGIVSMNWLFTFWDGWSSMS